MKLTVSDKPFWSIPVQDMADGQFAVAINGRLKGEIFFRNVAGLHGLTESRYWPSAYTLKTEHAYMPDFDVRLLTAEDIITLSLCEKDSKVPR